MAEEFNDLVQNDTWHLVPYCDDMNLLSCKWIYCIECNSDGYIEHQKACLVFKGFSELDGLDYNETRPLFILFLPFPSLTVGSFVNLM